VFRWLVQQKLQQLRQIDQYDAFVFTRADEAHLSMNIGQMLSDCRECSWFQEGKSYDHTVNGGISDRHWIASAEAFAQTINVTSSVFCASSISAALAM